MSNPNAVIIIIGNEILSGRTLDVNTKFIAEQLFVVGIDLEEARVIPDRRDVIISTVIELSKKCDYVFTTGGIGPTHDDITTEAVAAAFNMPVVLNHAAYKELEAYYTKNNQELNHMREKMAYIPEWADLIDNPVSGAPGFIIENVFVLPGVPRIMQAMLLPVLAKLKQGKPHQTKSYKVMIAESLVASDFADLQQKFLEVNMGSYPFKEDDNYGTSLVLSSSAIETLEAAAKELEQLLMLYNVTVTKS